MRFHGNHREARIQRFEARNSPRAKLIKKKARKAARRARAMQARRRAR